MDNITFKTANELFYLDEDPRTKHWFLIDSPKTVMLILAMYTAFVTKVGPVMMRDRKELQLKKFMLLYNVFQIVYCLGLVIFSFPPFLSVSLSCGRLSFAEDTIIIAQLSYAFFLLKIIDLLDTVIFVLRKKPRQITFLHVFHHVYVVILGYVNTRYLAGDNVVLLTLFNGTVHVAMYYYYLVTSLTHRAPWWKKYMTTMQLLQLTALAVYEIASLINPHCAYPKMPIFFFMILPNMLLISEFALFYIRSYLTRSKSNTNFEDKTSLEKKVH